MIWYLRDDKIQKFPRGLFGGTVYPKDTSFGTQCFEMKVVYVFAWSKIGSFIEKVKRGWSITH